MRSASLCLWACLSLLPTRIWSQHEEAPVPEIRLELLPIHIIDGVPRGFTFVLTNVSNGDLRIPPPDIDCGNPTPRGTLWLNESWVPISGIGLGKGVGICDFGGVYPMPTLTLSELTKTWKVLHPGETFRISADKDALHYEAVLSGSYIFSARYSPPQLSTEVKRLLSQSGIVIPGQSVATPEQHYVKPVN